jgi:hypothetical protein
MSRKSPRRKPDLFSALVLAVVVGVSVSIAYQLSTYESGMPPLAERLQIFVVTSGR